MFNHVYSFLRALRILWGLKTITRKNRYRLWRKSINLYLSFLAFTDRDRPAIQLRGAMTAAVLSAVYDYDTDWKRSQSPETSLFFRMLDELLRQHPRKEEATALARELFQTDWQNRLSADGLERGSVALRFYCLVIGSDWMSRYNVSEINSFGRKLQIVDDCLDLEQDRALGHTNCFRTSEATRFRSELIEFLASGFFWRLAKNSSIYRLLRRKCQIILGQTEKITLRQLFRTSHPRIGLYAIILALIGFRFFSPVPWLLAMFAAISFACITWSIMTWNDYVDREQDRKKGKNFASDNPDVLRQYWLAINTGAVCSLTLTMLLDWRVALFSTGCWGLGLCYSYIPHWYITQNLVVSFCSAAPVVVGSIAAWQINRKPLLMFTVLFFMVFNREIYLDMRDQGIDRGYKATIPVRQSQPGSAMVALVLGGFVWPLFIGFYPEPLVSIVGFAGVAVAFITARLFLHPKRAPTAVKTMSWTIILLFAAVALTQ